MITIHDNYNLLRHNTFRIDATCTRWIDYDDAADLPVIADMVEDQRFFNIGRGSNIVLYPHYDGTMLHSQICHVDTVACDGSTVHLTAGAGCLFDRIVEHAAARGLWGLENLSNIPGTVGASVVQNIGAYGVEIKDLVEKVDCYDLHTRRTVELRAEDCRFAYRDSLFKCPENRRLVVTAVTYRLSAIPEPKLEYGDLRQRLEHLDNPTPMQVRDAIIEMRAQKLPDPDQTGSAGSFFKNPVLSADQFVALTQLYRKYHGAEAQVPHYNLPGGDVKVPAAWLLDRCGFKGRQMGNVALWPTQPLIMVNSTGKATGPEISDISQYIADKVLETYGIHLQTEVEFI